MNLLFHGNLIDQVVAINSKLTLVRSLEDYSSRSRYIINSLKIKVKKL